MNSLLPELLALRPRDEDDALTMDLHVPPELAHFPGHFPGIPILPGVVQIDWAIRLARQHLNVQGEFESMENIKFQALVLPDARLTLVLTWNAVRRQLDFSYANSQRKYSTGRIVFCAAS